VGTIFARITVLQYCQQQLITWMLLIASELTIPVYVLKLITH